MASSCDSCDSFRFSPLGATPRWGALRAARLTDMERMSPHNAWRALQVLLPDVLHADVTCTPGFADGGPAAQPGKPGPAALPVCLAMRQLQLCAQLCVHRARRESEHVRRAEALARERAELLCALREAQREVTETTRRVRRELTAQDKQIEAYDALVKARLPEVHARIRWDDDGSGVVLPPEPAGAAGDVDAGAAPDPEAVAATDAMTDGGVPVGVAGSKSAATSSQSRRGQ